MNLSESDVQLFNDSLDRCIANPRFLDVFYDKFITSSPEVAEKFAGTNMAKQKRRLKAALYTAMLAADGNGPAIQHLRTLGRHHHLEIRIGPELYEFWRECLLATVEECGGFQDVRSQQVWNAVLDISIRIMKEPWEEGTPGERKTGE